MNFDRKINIIGDIDENSYKEFVEAIDALESILEDDIYIELHSAGGDAFTALAYYDKIRASKCNITIHAYGLVASAAVVILAAGDVRYMAPSAWVMVHEDEVILDEGTRVAQAEKQVKTARLIEDQWNKILASRCKGAASFWSTIHKQERYLSASECLQIGLVDKVI